MDDETYIVEICDAKKTSYCGVIKSLTAITKDLLVIEHALQPTSYWTYNGKNSIDIYSETYVSREE